MRSCTRAPIRAARRALSAARRATCGSRADADEVERVLDGGAGRVGARDEGLPDALEGGGLRDARRPFGEELGIVGGEAGGDGDHVAREQHRAPREVPALAARPAARRSSRARVKPSATRGAPGASQAVGRTPSASPA